MEYQSEIYVSGKWMQTNEKLEVFSPFDRKKVGSTFKAGADEIEQAITAAEQAFKQTRTMSVYERAEKLKSIAEGIRQNKEEFARILSSEAGKPIKTARQELDRAIFTFTDAAEECKRIRGEELPLDLDATSKNRWAITRRFPLGPILGISPFNFPLNLVSHKVAPALAAGNSIILKPASATPLSALRLAREISKSDWPQGTLNVLPMDSKNAHLLVSDERLKMLTFTGSPAVGWALKNQSGRKKVTLELGGNAAVIIHHDADLDYAADRCVSGGFGYAGQSCISVQRIYVHQDIFEKFMQLFIRKVKDLKVGDPADEQTDVGPMIDEQEIRRVKEWIDEAVKSGARLICGGSVDGNIMQPTILTDVDPRLRISCQEVFAPVVVVFGYSDVNEVISHVNDSDFGLQAGLFTRDARIIFKAYQQIEVGGLIVGDAPNYRIDHMPYGGVKQSGMGREGARYAIEEMTEPKLLVMNI